MIYLEHIPSNGEEREAVNNFEAGEWCGSRYLDLPTSQGTAGYTCNRKKHHNGHHIAARDGLIVMKWSGDWVGIVSTDITDIDETEHPPYTQEEFDAFLHKLRAMTAALKSWRK